MASLSLYLLGPPRIEHDGVPLKVDTRKAIALLAYLAITGESHRRDSLVNLLWPEYDQAHGRAALRRTLYALNKALAGDWLKADREIISLNSGPDIWLDVAQFHHHLAQCLTHGHPPDQVCPACLTPLIEMVELYRDDFLSGFSLKDSFNFDDWQFFQAESLRRELAGALEKLVQCYCAQGAFDWAISYARRWLALDRLNEAAHCQLMQLYAWTGQRPAALHQYQECARTLKSQLGIFPQESTIKLYQAIKSGRAPRPVPSVSRRLEPLAEQRQNHLSASPDVERAEPPATETLPAVLEEKRIVTLLFVDTSGSFAEMSKLDPEDEVTLVNRILGMMKDVLAEYGGEVERGLGGTVLAIFGRVQTHESDPELAIRAALEIQRQAGKLGLKLNAGITTGEIYVGRVDSGDPRGSTFVGAAVNMAMYLARYASGGQTLVGESTHDLTWRAFEFVPLSLQLQGLAEPVTAYQVVALLPHPQKARGIEGLSAELVGREGELAKLNQALAELLAGRGQMVSLIGEAGVGKSRLVAELQAQALHPADDRPAPLWLEGRCLELGTPASYWPFLEILQDYFGWSARDSNRQRRERIISSLRELVERGALSAERFEAMWPYLGLLLSVRLGEEWEERLNCDSPEQIRRQTFLAIHDFFMALARQHPVVLVFEDLHWADSLSLDLISLLMEGLRSGPLLVLCLYRPEREHKCWHLGTIASQKCRGRYTELRLRELTPRQSRQLVASLLAIESLSTSARNLILERSQGNPFFIEEVVRSLIDAGLVYRQGDYWRAKAEIGSMTIPDSVQNVILSRVDHLEEDWKHILQVAAVIGRLFRRRLLAYATQQQAELGRTLWKLEDRVLIYQERTIPEEEYSFKHVLTQETIYQNILETRRRAIHQQVAEAIEVLYQDDLDEYYEKLAYHYDQSGNVGLAVAYLLKAGEKAKRSYANEAAITHLSRGLELLKTAPETPGRARHELDLLVALGVPLIHTRGHAAPEVEATYCQARALCEQADTADPTQLFQILVGLRRYYFMRGELQSARELGERLLDLAQSLQDSSYLSRAHVMHGETLYHLGEFLRFLEHNQQGLALYNSQTHRSHIFLYGNDTGILCRVLAALAWWHLGYPDQALAWSQEGLSRAQELAHPFTLVCALFFTATLHQLRGESQIVRERAETLLRISEEQGFPLYLAWGTVLRGWALAERGETEGGIAQMKQGLEACRSAGAEIKMPYFLALLVEIYAQDGRIKAGLELLTEALALVDKNQDRSWEAELYWLRGELLLKNGGRTLCVKDEGDERKAASESPEECFFKAIEVARTQQARSWELRATVSLCRLWHSQGAANKRKDARQMLAEIYGWFTEGFDTVDLQEARALLEASK